MPKLLYPHLHRGWGYSDFGENLFYHTLKIKNAELVNLTLHFLFFMHVQKLFFKQFISRKLPSLFQTNYKVSKIE